MVGYSYMRFLYTALLLFVCLIPVHTGAQSLVDVDSVTISTAPLAPEPNTETTVSLNAYTYDTVGATIVWFIDGIEHAEARNKRELELTTKAIGEVTDITVSIRLRNGQTLSATHEIVPSRVDVVLEADTLVPRFYQGRALPSTGSTIRAIAIPHTASGASPQQFTYQWKLDNKVLYNGPVTGINTAEFKTGISRNQTLRVDVLNNDGVVVAAKTIIIPQTKPRIIFYEENPLRGSNNIALQSPHILTTDETSVRAEPYYMNADIFSVDPLLEWEVDSKTIDNPSTDPQYITLRKTGLGGRAKINFHIRNLQELTQGVEDSFVINF